MTVPAVPEPPALPGAVLTEDDLYGEGVWRDERQIEDNIIQGLRITADRIPIRYRDAVADAPEVIDWVRALVQTVAREKPRIARVTTGPSLLLIGGTGSGKTYQAYGAVRALAVSGAGLSWMFTTAADLYGVLRPRHKVDSEEEFERYLRPGLLVLDDIGAAKGSEWNEEINYRLINHRYEMRKPTLITSNVPSRDLPAALGERVASRLVEMCSRVTIKGGDRRIGSRGAA